MDLRLFVTEKSHKTVRRNGTLSVNFILLIFLISMSNKIKISLKEYDEMMAGLKEILAFQEKCAARRQAKREQFTEGHKI